MSENNDTLAWALLAVQKEMPAIEKDSKATVPTKSGGKFEYEYVSLDHLLAVVLPVLHNHNLVLSQAPSMLPDGSPALTTRLLHAPSGEVLSETMPLLLPQDNPQGLGSGITYARRYALTAILGISGQKDDDGALASTSTGSKRRRNIAQSAQEPPSRPAVPRGDKMRLRIQELASEADTMREADRGTTWDEVTKVVVWRHEQQAEIADGESFESYGATWDSLSESGLEWLGSELKAYVDAGSTGMSFFEHVSVPF